VSLKVARLTVDFKQINAIQQAKQKLESRRHGQAEACLTKAFQCLQEAFDPHFVAQKKTLILAAFDAFAEALQQQRSNPEIYIGLAYLLIACKDFAQAFNYLQEGQRLAPDHPDIKHMLSYLNQRSKSVSIQENQPSSKPFYQAVLKPISDDLSEADYDQLYEEIESQMNQVLKHIQSEQLPLKPSLEIAHSHQIRLLYEQYLEQQSHFVSQLAVLDQEFDTSELQQKLALLNVFLKRCKGLLSGANELSQLNSDLAALFKSVENFLKALSENFSQALSTLPPSEELLDQCDILADRLDECEQKGYQTAELLQVYDKLVIAVENLQNMLDEHVP
jgi:tetratricopeptide (TPR) repeat protein